MSTSTPFSSSLTTSSSTTTASPRNGTNLSTINEFLLACGDSCAIHESRITSKKLTINEELRAYKKSVIEFYNQQMPTASSSLNFWQKNYIHFPILSQFARLHLSTPGTSIASESAFSISSYVARKERARLSSDSLSFAMFMKDKIMSNN